MNIIRFCKRLLRGDSKSPAGRDLRGAARILLVGVLAAAAASCGKPSTETGQTGAGEKTPAARAAIGSPAPEFTLADLNGNPVASSSLRGKVVILDFWATWCPPCREEIPHFVNLQSKYRDQGLQIVGVSLDAGGAKDVKPFADEHDVNYTMLIGNEDIARTYGNIYAIPTTFVLDRSGKIVQRFVGFTAPEVIEATVKPLLTAS